MLVRKTCAVILLRQTVHCINLLRYCVDWCSVEVFVFFLAADFVDCLNIWCVIHKVWFRRSMV